MPDTDFATKSLGPKTGIQLGLLVTLIMLGIPLTGFLWMLKSEMAAIRSDMKTDSTLIQRDMVSIRQSLEGIWTLQMQQAWGERLGYWNTNRIVIPSVRDVYNDYKP